jgi:phosphoglycerol transferase MdoB-like AlkP superfamily enzyme
MTAARRRLLLANGVFLVVVGGVQFVFELLAYYAGIGPYGYVFEESPYTIGWVEAHGLAFIIGVLLLTVAARDGRRFWHVLAASVHTLLGTANLVFWESFEVFGMVPMGILATVVHFVFVVAHIGAYVLSRERTSA